MDLEKPPGKRPKKTHIHDRAPRDFYQEPPHVAAAIFAHERFDGLVHDPACGEGRIVHAARDAGYIASGADIVERASGFQILDFYASQAPVDNIVCNPAYKGVEDFIAHALELAQRKVALILPYNCLFGLKRADWIESTPLATIWRIAPRPSLPPGELIQKGLIPGGGRVDFCVFVWSHGHNGPPVSRIMRAPKPRARGAA